MDQLQLTPLLVNAHVLIGEILDELLRLALVVGQMHSLVNARQAFDHSRGPITGSPRAQVDVTREILIICGQPIRQPRAHRGMSWKHVPGIQHEQ